jgi:hypothetical protein
MAPQAIPAGGVSQRKERADPSFHRLPRNLVAGLPTTSASVNVFAGGSNMNPISRIVLSTVSLLALSLFPLAGCDDNSAGSKPASVDQVTLHIEDVPADVACLRITATGTSRQVVRDLDVTLGQSVSESFSGLPIGDVVFQAAAYSQTCDKVTKSTIPSWISEEVSVTVSLTHSTSVSLTLYQNGRAKVTVGFDPEVDAGTPDGG